MKVIFNAVKFFVLTLIMLSITSLAGASGGVNWGYDGEHGPDKWHSLSSDFALCESGQSQSPINIDKTESAHLSRASGTISLMRLVMSQLSQVFM